MCLAPCHSAKGALTSGAVRLALRWRPGSLGDQQANDQTNQYQHAFRRQGRHGRRDGRWTSPQEESGFCPPLDQIGGSAEHGDVSTIT